MELPCSATRVTDCTHKRAIAAEQNPDHVVLPVGNQQVFLGCVMREGNIVIGSHANCLRVHEKFLYEFPFLCKHLNPVVGAIANIHQPVLRNMHAMNGIPWKSLLTGAPGT